MVGLIHSVETFGAVDGPGIRYVVFLQGCPLRCLYCHNPDTWNPSGGIRTDSEELVREILRYQSFWASGGGVTLSGGEPLLQAEFSYDILYRLKAEGAHTALDTSGGVSSPAARKLLMEADLVLLDVKALEDELHRRLTGMSVESTLSTLAFLAENHRPVWIRHVLLPGYTLEESRLTSLAEYLTPFKNIEKVELLSFHKMGEYKWEELGISYSLGGTPPPTQAEKERAAAIFSATGLPLSIR